MRFLSILIIASIAFKGFGQSNKVQLNGTHAFIEVPDSFSYWFDIGGYADSLSQIFISAARAPEGLKTVKHQFTDQTRFETVNRFNTRHLIFSMQQKKNGRTFTGYLILIGDKNESALITILADNEIDNLKIVESLISSITWDSKSNLNFEDDYFFEVAGLENFTFLNKIYSNFTFAHKTAKFPKPEFTITIGTNVILADYEGQKKYIVEYLINPNQDLVFTLSKEFQDLTIDGHESITVKWTYEREDKTEKLYFTTLFAKGRIYFIEAKSINPDFDYLFDNYQDMITSFKLKI